MLAEHSGIHKKEAADGGYDVGVDVACAARMLQRWT